MPADSGPIYFGGANTSQASPTDNPADKEETLARANEAIYKQNFELAVRNKTLSVLRAMYEITMTSLNVAEVAQRIVDTIVEELGFLVAIISLVDEEKKVLRFAAVTKSGDIEKAIDLMVKPLKELTIDLDYTENLIVNAIKDNERKITGNLLDIFSPAITQEVADSLDKATKIKTVIIYPLYFGQKALGSLSIGIAKKADDLSRAEKESLEQLINVVVIALERAILHEDLQRANDKMQELDKLKDEFVSLASHELRTPMTAIRGSLSTILEGYAGIISKEAQDFLSAAYNENDRLIRLVNNLLNISRIEAGRFRFNPAPMALEAVAADVVNNMQMAAKEKNLTLIYKRSEPLPPVMADDDKVREVLINIIGNAIKFTHKGGVTVASFRKDNMVITSVTDTGSGIAKEDQDLLFKKFSQIQGSYAKQSGGTGLGLYISKQIIEGHNGKVWLESTLGVGSTFYFSLPIAT